MCNRYNKMVPSKFWFICIIFLFTLLTLAGHSLAATYYVSTSGSDSNACASTGASACATINGAISKAADGDTIKVEPGNYNFSNDMYIDGFNGLTITAYDQQNKPIITKASEGFIEISKHTTSNNIEISYLVLDNGSRRTSYWYGIVDIWDGNGHHIHNNEIRDGYHGIEIRAGHSMEINNNTIHNFGKINSGPQNGDGHGVISRTTAPASWNEKIYIHHNDIYDCGGDSIQLNSSGPMIKYHEISYNDLHDNEENSIDLKESQNISIHHNTLYNNRGSAFTTHSGSKDVCAGNIDVYNNSIHDNGWWGIIINCGSNWTVNNNLFYRNATDSSRSSLRALKGNSSCEVYYNTFYDNGSAAGTSHSAYKGNCTVKNNIFFNNLGPKGNIDNNSGGTIDKNYVYPTSPGITGSNPVTVSNPLFVDETAGNFNLLGGSQLIDSAVNVGVTTDFQDNVRPAGGGYDIGAYEFGGTSGDYVAPDPPINFQVVLN